MTQLAGASFHLSWLDLHWKTRRGPSDVGGQEGLFVSRGASYLWRVSFLNSSSKDPLEGFASGWDLCISSSQAYPQIVVSSGGGQVSSLVST